MVLVRISIFTMTKFWGYGLTVFLTTLLSVSSSRSSRTAVTVSQNLDPIFRCENGERIVLTKHNDGVDDCGDNSDEYNEALLFYTVLHPDELSDPVMRGFFLKTDGSTFRSRLTPSCPQPWTLLGAHGRYVYLMCPGHHDHLIQAMRNGSLVQDISRNGKEIQALVFDEVISNAYLLENSRIKLCDSDFVFCALLQGKLRHKPISLAFSSERGLLFWIEKKKETETLIVSARRDGTEAKIIQRDNTDPFEYVTVDRSAHRLYWIGNETKNIFSSSFDGTDKKLHGIALNNVHTFVVDNGRLFWADQVKSEAETCDIETNARARCNFVRYKSEFSQVHIGKNIIIHKSTKKTTKEGTNGTALAPKEEEIEDHICDRSTCSHLCTYLSETEHTCFCDTSETDFLPSLHNGFCEGVTLLVTLGNHLYVVGFKNKLINKNYAPIIRKTTLKNVDSVSTVTYDSIQGRVILAETGRQNIYAWMLGRREAELITDEGRGTINSIEFDDVGNNIYWISPSDFMLKATSCVTNKTVDIFGENSSTTLFDFTLDPKNGYAFILSKTDASVNLERISMSGDASTVQLLYRFDHTNMTYLAVHYMRSKDILILMDRLNGEIKYAEMLKKYRPDGTIKFEYLTDNDLNGLNSATSLLESVIWTEDDGSFRSVEVPAQERNPVQRLALNLPKGPISIAGIVSAQESTRSGCRIRNGGCQDLCLVSNATSFVCRCSSGLCEKSEKEHESPTPPTTLKRKDVEFIDREENSERSEVKPELLTNGTSASILEYTSLPALALLAAILSILVYKLVKNRKTFNHSLYIRQPTVSTTSSLVNMSLMPGEN